VRQMTHLTYTDHLAHHVTCYDALLAENIDLGANATLTRTQVE